MSLITENRPTESTGEAEHTENTETTAATSETTTEPTVDPLEAIETATDITETEEMNTIIRSVLEKLEDCPLPSFFDRSFVYTMIESDIRGNLRFFKTIRNDEPYYMVQIDEYNGIFLPLREFLNMVLPTYLMVQMRSAFGGLTTIREILNDIASTIQDELERLTIAASEEEFKEAKFNKKDISTEELNSILDTLTTETVVSEPLDECPLCGNESIDTFYECKKCRYKYCADCCTEIASRQRLCPCCREDMELIKHSH